MQKTKDPMGAAISDFYYTGKADVLRVFSPDFDEDEIPVETLFRTFDNMPELEQKALLLSKGQILDVGAGAGCHSIALQDMNKDVTSVDISPLSVEVMKLRGVKNVLCQDFFTLDDKYDTILMLMNGIGIVGSIDGLPNFFKHLKRILTLGGQVLVDSSDISYVFEDEDGLICLPETDFYYGELQYEMQYKDIKGDVFPWLYIDYNTLKAIADENGFDVELISEGEHYEYLAKIVHK